MPDRAARRAWRASGGAGACASPLAIGHGASVACAAAAALAQG
jgi:hypothetical protein